MVLNIQSIGNPRYIALETVRKNGEAVITPVWCAAENGRLYAFTDGSTGKVKRIRNNPNVKICVCTYSGTPKSEWVEATAKIQDSREDILHAHRLLMAKYWLQYRLINIVSPTLGPKSKVVIIEIT